MIWHNLTQKNLVVHKNHLHLHQKCGTPDYVNVNVIVQDDELPPYVVDTRLQFSFDFRTWEIVLEYGENDYAGTLVKAFEKICSSPSHKVTNVHNCIIMMALCCETRCHCFLCDAPNTDKSILRLFSAPWLHFLIFNEELYLQMEKCP